MNRAERRGLDKLVKKSMKEGVKMDQKDKVIKHLQAVVKRQADEIGQFRTESISLKIELEEAQQNLQVVSQGYMELKAAAETPVEDGREHAETGSFETPEEATDDEPAESSFELVK